MSARRLVAPLRPTLIAAAVSCCFASFSAFSNPTGPTVVNGTATIVPAGPVLNITNTPNAIINWQSFSINPGETTRFIQQSASSAVLNRVTTPSSLSSIHGALQSNGRVFLVNPSGILFGSGAQVDVAGLVASTLNLTNEDFLAGRLRFAGAPLQDTVVQNLGTIRTAEGGHVYLIGNRLGNGGSILAPKGQIVLAAGQSVELVDPTSPSLRVEVTSTPANEAVNFGDIIAEAGRVGIYAGLISNFRTISANRAEIGARGEILLKSSGNVVLAPTSIVSTTEPGEGANGKVDIQAGGSVTMNGTVFLDGDLSVRSGGDFTVDSPGSPTSSGIAANRISVESGGNIVLNGVPQSPARRRAALEADFLSLKATTPGKTITQDEDGFIRAFERLDIAAAGDVNLLSSINGFGSAMIDISNGGNFSMTATSGGTTLLGANMRGDGAFSLSTQTVTLFVVGNISAGPVSLSGSGLIIGSAPNSVTVSAKGPMSLSGNLRVNGGTGPGDFTLVTATGPIDIVSESIGINGGTGLLSPAMIVGQDTISMRSLLDIRFYDGPRFGSFARVQTLSRNDPITVSLPLHTSGGFLVNDVEGRVSQGLTGFFTGLRPAVPGQTLLLDYGAPAP